MKYIKRFGQTVVDRRDLTARVFHKLSNLMNVLTKIMYNIFEDSTDISNIQKKGEFKYSIELKFNRVILLILMTS